MPISLCQQLDKSWPACSMLGQIDWKNCDTAAMASGLQDCHATNSKLNAAQAFMAGYSRCDTSVLGVLLAQDGLQIILAVVDDTISSQLLEQSCLLTPTTGRDNMVPSLLGQLDHKLPHAPPRLLSPGQSAWWSYVQPPATLAVKSHHCCCRAGLMCAVTLAKEARATRLLAAPAPAPARPPPPPQTCCSCCRPKGKI